MGKIPTTPPKILTAVLQPGENLADAKRRTEAEYGSLGKPGPMLPWHRDQHGGWHRTLAGSGRVVATVDKYPPDLGGGYFYCVGDGPTEESSETAFGGMGAAKVAADIRLKEMGYTEASLGPKS